MVRNNNVIPNGHFHKNWQVRVKTWFKQPLRKRSRLMKRKLKMYQKHPMPNEPLRPLVHCPSSRYNSKVRIGRGFTAKEIKGAGLSHRFASTIGISIDFRRRNVSKEAMTANVQRLKEYKSKLVIYSLNRKKKKEEMKQVLVPVRKGINKLSKPVPKLKARIPTKEEKQFNCYHYVAKARSEAKYLSRRLKRKTMGTEGFELPSKKVRLQSQDLE